MGDYTDQAKVEIAAGGSVRLVQLADYDGDGTADTSVVDDAILAAESLVNSYARKVFDVPFDPVPPIIERIATKLAVYDLRDRRDAVTPEQRLEQDDRLKWLENLARGLVDPGITPSPTPSGHNRPVSSERPSTKAVSRDALKGFS